MGSEKNGSELFIIGETRSVIEKQADGRCEAASGEWIILYVKEMSKVTEVL